MLLFKEAKDKEKIKQIKKHPYYAEDLKRIRTMHEKIKDKPIEVLTKSQYFIFHETGNRLEFELKYFERRTRLNIYFIEYLLYEREEDLKRLEDIIWAICGEFSWALPAHVGWENAEEDMICIDLFAAETGQTLSEILYILEDQLSEYIKTVMRYEINRRIIESFEQRTQGWETVVTNNWAAVCAGGVGMTFIYCAPEKYKSIENRIMGALKHFLSGYGDDGICTEGLGYWDYGFGYYTFFAQLLYEFSDGKTDIMNQKKVREIAQFQQRMYLSGNAVISFSDCNRHLCFKKGLTHKLKEIFPDCVTVPDKEYEDKDFYGYLNRFPVCLRNLLWSEPEYAESSAVQHIEKYYPEAQWYTHITDRFGFAAKSGNNDEPHNHNDVGSFIIAADNRQYIAEIGVGEYTKGYFGAGRYHHLCCSSKGHSVPIIDNHEQPAGQEYCGKVLKAQDGQFVLDISGAYDVDGLSSAIRTFSVCENGVALNDRFNFGDGKQHRVQECFISLIEPEECDGFIKIGQLKMSGMESYHIERLQERDHHSGELFSIWRIECDVQNYEISLKFELA